jgi:hypothetical protein
MLDKGRLARASCSSNELSVREWNVESKNTRPTPTRNRSPSSSQPFVVEQDHWQKIPRRIGKRLKLRDKSMFTCAMRH